MSSRSQRRAAKAAKRKKRVSPPRRHAESPSRGLLAARDYDTHYGLRSALAELGEMREEWAGIPMPLDDQRLVVEPSYPKAKELMGIGEKPAVDDGRRVRNIWYSTSKRCEVVIIEEPSGKLTWGFIPGVHHFSHDLQTLGCMDAWGLEQEQRALLLLGTMVRHRQMKQYVLTGMFLESSRRSGIFYMFRRLKPTVAMKAGKDGQMKILASLCMHPIAYYSGSWAGAMCPTDDVVAHLAMMRADEHLFWKRSNQHEPHRPEAGL